MIIYNRKQKLQQGGAADLNPQSSTPSDWYGNQGGANTVQSGAQLAGQVGSAIDTTGPAYMSTAPQGNMNIGAIETVDPNIQKQGQGAGALKGAAAGATAGAALGPVGAVVGGAIGGTAGWLSARKKGKVRKEEATAQYDQQVAQAQSNYGANARNQYAQQYAAYRQQGGTMSSDPMANQMAAQPMIPRPTVAAQPGMPVQGNVVPQPGMMQQQGMYKNGGSFGSKVSVLMSKVSKKA